MPVNIKYVCDLCGNELPKDEKPEVFIKPIPPYYRLKIYVCKECYNRMFGEQLEIFKKDQERKTPNAK